MSLVIESWISGAALCDEGRRTATAPLPHQVVRCTYEKQGKHRFLDETVDQFETVEFVNRIPGSPGHTTALTTHSAAAVEDDFIYFDADMVRILDLTEDNADSAKDRNVVFWFKESAAPASGSTYFDFQPVINDHRKTTSFLLRRLEGATSSQRNSIFTELALEHDPEDILNASLALYQSHHKEAFLVQAISLLEAIGTNAWPALQSLAIRRDLPECELFVPVIAEFESVSVEERLSVLRELAKSRHAGVRQSVREQQYLFETSHHRQLFALIGTAG